jgi:hypothetical protein
MHMSCRIAVNMAKRAAAGAISVSVWPDEETDSPFRGTEPAPVSRINSRYTSRKTITLKYDLARIIAVALIAFAALSFVSYAVYAHQWSELSAMRHLGNPTEQNGYW